MPFDPSVFVFGEMRGLDPGVDLVARVPAGIAAREALFDLLQRELSFPAYFGGNWDALADCLRDLSWVEERRVVVVHEDLPALDEGTLGTYLDVLSDCARDWKPGEQHEFVVVFPATARDTVIRLARA
jgi:RNAse (barnase) inhibitor barstar